MASRATLKLNEELDDIKRDILETKNKHEIAISSGLTPVVREYHQELGLVYVKSAITVGRIYGPTIIIGVASISMLTGSHVQLTRRNSALTATLAAISKAYDEYRLRVQEAVGKDRELDIYHGTKTITTGQDKGTKVLDPSAKSVYSFLFDETTSSEWQNSSEMNRTFLDLNQRYFNIRLNQRGHVFLNEVLDQLRLDHTPAGALTGWVKDSKDGDSFIDFGFYDNNLFMNGQEKSVWLDFNVDGVIYDKI
jgi:type II secretory pathway pseudopilin PulG